MVRHLYIRLTNGTLTPPEGVNSTKISVIIPVFNSDTSIEKCIRSILIQTLDEIEVICIDEGSTDESMAVIEKITDEDERVKTFHKKHMGAGPARNTGIERAEGEFLSGAVQQSSVL